MKNGIVALVALAGLATGASAANTWIVDISYSNPGGRIMGPGDTATVTIWAGFDANLYAFAGGALNVDTDDDASGSWSNFGRDLTGPGTFDGNAVGGDVNGIITGQLHFPPAGIFADTSNPIKAWHGTFTTSDFSFRDVSLKTVSTKFAVYINDAGVSQDFINTLIEGSGSIAVGVPTPATAGLLGLGALAATRRRR